MRFMLHELLKVIKGIFVDIIALRVRNDVEEFFFKMSTCDITTLRFVIMPVSLLTRFATVPGSFTAAAFHGIDVLTVRAVGITAEVGMAHVVMIHYLADRFVKFYIIFETYKKRRLGSYSISISSTTWGSYKRISLRW